MIEENAEAKSVRPRSQLVGILRRSSTNASRDSAAASLNKSDHKIDYEYDAPDSVPITDPIELADRLINFKQKIASSTADNSNGNRNQSNNSRGHRPPPPPPPRPLSRRASSDKQRNEMISAPPFQDRRSSDSTYCDDTDVDYVCRMEEMKLEQSDHTAQGKEFQNNALKNPLSPQTPAKNDESDKSFTPRPVRVSQFEDTGPSPPLSKSVMASRLSTKLASVTQKTTSRSSVSSIASLSTVSSVPKNCDKRGRCIFHPLHKVYKKKLLGGYELIGDCPVCLASPHSNPKGIERRNTYDHASVKKVSGRNSRSIERARSKSADRMPTTPKLEENGDSNHGDTSERPYISGRMRTGTNSAEDRVSSSRGRQRRTRSHSRRGRSRSSQRRSTSRGERRSSDNDFSMDNKSSFEKALGALDQRVRGKSNDKHSKPKVSASYDETAIRKKKNLGSNPFVRQSECTNFDKKTGRCKKHPSIILAKKSTFRSNSWEMIRKNGCPLCSEAKVGTELEVDQGLDEESQKNMERLLNYGRNSSAGSSSSSHKVEARKTSSLRRSGNSLDLVDSIPPEMTRNRKVSKMRYTTPLGETGWYTGEVDLEGNPHGSGRMRFKTGHSYEGVWKHGYSEAHMENINRMRSGFGSNKAAWKQSEMAPSVRKAAAAKSPETHDAAKPVISSAAAYQYQHNSPHQGYSQAQIQSAQIQQWTNMSPQERQMAMAQWYANNPGQQYGYHMQGYPHM